MSSPDSLMAASVPAPERCRHVQRPQPTKAEDVHRAPAASRCSGRDAHCQILQQTQRGHGGITGWFGWFARCRERALINAEERLETMLANARSWRDHASISLNDRRR
jgi:hypothetical protein